MRIAIIGGTGMEQVAGFAIEQESEPEPGVTVFEGRLQGEPVLLMPRHGRAHRVPPHRIEHVRHVQILQRLGVEAVLATAAVGSLRPDWEAGTLIVLSDFLDLMRQVYTLHDHEVAHSDFSEPFSPLLRRALLQAASEEGIPVQSEGVYVGTPGPRYETPAEIRMFRLLGGDVIGMTVVPEAVLCRESGIQYAAVAAVTNLGTGLQPNPLSHGEVTQMMSTAQGQIVRLFARAIKNLDAV